MQESRAYVFGTDSVERDRLVQGAKRQEGEANWLLDQIGVRPGWHCVDIGCGPLGILHLLAEQVGPEGRVVGVEREAPLLEVARRLVAERGWSTVELVEADGCATGLPREAFDLVHERLVLGVSPTPEQLVAEMVALVRPGGWVALEDLHQATGLCYPPHPAYDRLVELNTAVSLHRGQDPFIGARLPTLLRAAGLDDVRVHAHSEVFPGAERYRQLAAMWAGMRDEAVARGFTTDAEVTELLEALGLHMRAPDTLGVRHLQFQAWGHKPAA